MPFEKISMIPSENYSTLRPIVVSQMDCCKLQVPVETVVGPFAFSEWISRIRPSSETRSDQTLCSLVKPGM
jgi:hypothetical protein